MIAFEVVVNGKRICTAGQRHNGTLSADITRYHMVAKRSPTSPDVDRVLKEGMSLSVGGIQHGAMSRYLTWANHELSVGDEIVIRVLDTELADEPATTSGAFNLDSMFSGWVEGKWKKIASFIFGKSEN